MNTRALIVMMACASSTFAGDWPGFRGDGSGIAPNERNMPLTWSDKQNIAWRVPLSDPGNSSPIVWGDRLFLTAAADNGAKRLLICFDRNTGKQLWQNGVEFQGDEPLHKTNTHCAATPVTDGKAVYGMFGSAGMAAFDFNGKLLWKRELGPIVHIWGSAPSPVLYQDMVIQHVGPGENVALVAMDKTDGHVIWKKELAEARVSAGPARKNKDYFGSWSTPRLHNNHGKDELLLSLPGYIAGFNPQTGAEFWRCGGLTDLVYTSPVFGKEFIVAMSGFSGAAIGLKVPDGTAKGDITSTHQLWREPRNTQRIGSGVVIGKHLFHVEEPGLATCIEMDTGKQLYRERMSKTTWTSVVYADKRLYILDQDGTCHVLEPSTSYKLLATNKLAKPEMTRASIVPSDGQFFIRTYENLYAVGVRQRRAG
jgi:outer membrane protein assembly factor BamB